MKKLFQRSWSWIRGLVRAAGGGSEFLCDTCRYDHGGACNRRQRPNATRCDGYRGN